MKICGSRSILAPERRPAVSIGTVWKRRLAPYLVALLSVALATVIAIPIYPSDGDFPALLPLVAVAITASVGGFWPALVATIGGFFALDYFFESPALSFAISALGTSLDLIAFAFVAVLLGVLNARLRSARQRADAARTQAEVALRARDEALT